MGKSENQEGTEASEEVYPDPVEVDPGTLEVNPSPSEVVPCAIKPSPTAQINPSDQNGVEVSRFKEEPNDWMEIHPAPQEDSFTSGHDEVTIKQEIENDS